MTGDEAVIYHNPECGTSRNTLALMRHAGVEPRVIDYQRDPPTRMRLVALIQAGPAPANLAAIREAKLPRQAQERLEAALSLVE